MSADETPSDTSSSETDTGSITVVGTAHVSPESLADVRSTIADQDPDVVAVELCGRRYTGPTPEGVPYAGDDKSPNLRTLLFLPLMQYLQSRAADQRGLDSDVTDMGAAVDSAIATDADLALLDRDILTTFERYWDAASLRETLRVIASLGFAIVGGDSTLLDAGTADAETATDTDTDVIDDYLTTTEQRFPAFRTVFIDERDMAMAARLAHLKQNGYDIVAVVGAAHKPGINAALDTIQTPPTTESTADATTMEPAPDADTDTGTDAEADPDPRLTPTSTPLLDPRPDIKPS